MDTTSGTSACVEDGGGGGDKGGASAAALDCICAACEVVAGGGGGAAEVTSGATDVAMDVDVAAVRARERVHRRPLTVVTDSCGVAMQKTGS